MCMQVLMHRSTLLPFRYCPSCVFRQGLSLAWDSSVKLWWPENEPQRPACPHLLQHWSYKGTLHMVFSFWCGFLAWNPGLDAWKAGIPHTKPSPALSSCFNVRVTLKWESVKGDVPIALPVHFSLDTCKCMSFLVSGQRSRPRLLVEAFEHMLSSCPDIALSASFLSWDGGS